MPNLKELLENIFVLEIMGSQDIFIKSIGFDSREIQKNTLFFAIKGTKSNGHFFIEKAIKLGATAVVCEHLPSEIHPKITYIKVSDSAYVLSGVAANFYQNPSKKIKLIGVTGTNGKTTVASLLYQLFKKQGKKVGLISTVQILMDNEKFPATHTTPNPIALQNYLSQMLKKGLSHCFMEVSSHGIDQKRTAHLHFSGAIFTNLSQDHLDYHKTFANYRNTKKKLFDNLPSDAFALVNADDKNAHFILQNTAAKKVFYSLKNYSDLKGAILEKTFEGMLLSIKNDVFEKQLWVALTGTFNAYNVLAIFATAKLLGLGEENVLLEMSLLKNVSGRFDYFISETGLIVMVDYAHTPNALENILKTILDIKTNKQRIFTVVGCGGNRDSDKRPKMGKIAVQYSNFSIFTADNPRNEDPEKIIIDMQTNISQKEQEKLLCILDRKQAMKTALMMAKPKDIILIAGKGHENYQEIKGKRYPFDDKKNAEELLRILKK